MNVQEFYLKAVLEITTALVNNSERKVNGLGLTPYEYKKINEAASQMTMDLICRSSTLWSESGKVQIFGDLYSNTNNK